MSEATVLASARLGTTSVRVSELGFGAAPIGNLYKEIDDETALLAVRTAWAEGIRYFDTAPHYGLGLSERRLGAALADFPREDFTVSTKVGRLLVPNPASTGSDLAVGGFAVADSLTRVRDYSRDGVLRSVEASLERLGLDRVDIVYVHDPEDYLDDAIGHAMPALAELRAQGMIGAIGAGMNFVAPLQRIVTECDVDVVMIAGRWTLVDRTAQPLLEQCVDRGVSVVSAAPFNSGLLAQDWPADGARFDYGPAPAAILARARRIATVCREFGRTLPQVACLFPLRHPAVVSVVSGMRTAAQAAQGAGWITDDAPPEIWAAIDEAAAE